MVSEVKSFASLSSGLLARKGAARPAMRPQGFGQGGSGLDDLGWNDMGADAPKPGPVARSVPPEAVALDVVEHPRAAHPTGLTPVQSPVHSQQAQIVDRFATEESEAAAEPEHVVEVEPVPVAPAAIAVQAPAEARASRSRPAATRSKAKAAFTLRLESARHLKLRLACAVNGRSAQQLVTAALDQFLESMPELEEMAERAKRKG